MSGERTRKTTEAARRRPPRLDPPPARPHRQAVIADAPPYSGAPPAPFQAVPLPPLPPPRERIEATMGLFARWGIPLLLFAGSLLVLGTHYDDPPGIIFDEAHYIHWSREIARGNLLTDDARVPQSPVNYEHPPLAKHLMAASLRFLHAGQLDLTWEQYEKGCATAEPHCPDGRVWEGCSQPRPACRPEALAWRLPGLLAGASAVPAVYLLGLRLFNSLPGGLFAAALLLLDNLWYLQSRMAMLDIFAAAFAVWGFALVLGRGRLAPFVAALVFGAALASKYTAFFLLPVFLLAQYARSPARSPVARAFTAIGLGLLLPVAAFAASYLPYAVHWFAAGGLPLVVQRFLYVQVAALGWDFGGTFEHSSASPPWAWIPHLNPTFYYWPGYDQFTRDQILRPPFMYAVGNPALWWPATIALVLVPAALLAWWVRRRLRFFLRSDVLRALPRLRFHLSPAGSLAVAALLFWASFLPWFLLRRTTFNYYATFNVPYFALFAAGLLHLAWRSGPRGRVAATAYLAFVGAWFTAWWPIVSGAPVGATHFDAVWGLVPWMSR
jgi:dolichyl-phosphate-mannose-protein mannosyltransferase